MPNSNPNPNPNPSPTPTPNPTPPPRCVLGWNWSPREQLGTTLPIVRNSWGPKTHELRQQTAFKMVLGVGLGLGVGIGVGVGVGLDLLARLGDAATREEVHLLEIQGVISRGIGRYREM